MTSTPLWTVTIAPGTSIHEVAASLRDSGLTITDVFDAIGVINGHASNATLPKLQGVSGVVDVSPNLDINIGPPDAPIS